MKEAFLKCARRLNDGVMEDIATGSAVGAVGTYLIKRRRVTVGEEFILRQGRFLGRQSAIHVCSEGTPDAITRVRVGGGVALVSRGVLSALPVVLE